MANRDKLKLQTNIPLLCTLINAFYAPSLQYEDQIQLHIGVDGSEGYGSGEFNLFLGLWAVKVLEELNCISTGGTEEKPKYKVLAKNIKLLINRKEAEGNRKETEIRRVDSGAVQKPAAQAPAAAQGSGKPASQQDGPGAPGNGHSRPQREPLSGVAIKRAWFLMAEEISAALIAASHGMMLATGCEASDLDQQAIGSIANGLMIRAEKQSLVGTPGLAHAILLATNGRVGYAKEDPKAGKPNHEKGGQDREPGEDPEDDDGLPF